MRARFGTDRRTKPRAPTWALVLPILTMAASGQWPTGTEVTETLHNLTVAAKNTAPQMSGRIEDYDEVCVYCHTSHAADVERALWNRPTPTGPYRMFEGTDMLMDPQPTGNSLACLSCHDGTIGLDEVLNLPNTYAGPGPERTTIDRCESCHKGPNPGGGLDFEGVWLDTDLRDDHPISILYDPSRDPDFRSAAEVEAAGLMLYEGKVQCMTCHEPHSQQFQPFLRISNAGGSLCLACHQTPPAEQTAHHW